MSKDAKNQPVAELPETEYKTTWPQEKDFKYLKK